MDWYSIVKFLHVAFAVVWVGGGFTIMLLAVRADRAAAVPARPSGGLTPTSMTIDSATFRSVLGRFASGITIVTALDDRGEDHGMTVSAFCSASLDPPLVLACIDRAATMHPVLERATHFAVNILSSEQEALSRRFATPEVDPFDGIGYTRGTAGLALIDDALAHLECRVHARVPGGDHMILLGLVESGVAWDARPLLYYRSGYAQLER